ncbi:MAG: hypothetical protein P8Z00_18800 [Anaerolineales bacterium]|jgi:hypothetical protein
MLDRNPSYQPHHHLEPFGEPRTMAELWDLSHLATAMMAVKKTTRVEVNESDPSESELATSQENGSVWDKFPQPATIPAGWDLSELL